MACARTSLPRQRLRGARVVLNQLRLPEPTPREMSDDPFVGTRYRALAKLRTGQRGELYVVEHLGLGKRFAAKVLRRELLQDPRAVDRLRLEAQSLGRLRHPNVVNIIGFEQAGDTPPFIVMELLRGRDLDAEVTERGPLPIGEAMEIADQLLSAMDAAHAIGIIHRELRPKNVFLHESATVQRIAKLLDFGKVRIDARVSTKAPPPLTLPTEAGTCLDGAEFLSPEANRGEVVDRRSDLYQVGLLLLFMLTGARAESMTSASAAASSDPRGPSLDLERLAALPFGLRDLIRCALARNPEERIQTAAEFRRQLMRVAAATEMTLLASVAVPSRQGQTSHAPSGPARQPWLRPTRPFMPKWLVFLALAIGATLLVVALGQSFRGMP